MNDVMVTGLLGAMAASGVLSEGFGAKLNPRSVLLR